MWFDYPNDCTQYTKKGYGIQLRFNGEFIYTDSDVLQWWKSSWEILGFPTQISYIYQKDTMFILYYLLIGITIMFLLDMHLLMYTKQIEKELEEKIEYDTFTRIFIIVVWPAALFIIIKNIPRGF